MVGNLTIDYINGERRPGGPGYYSSIALALLGEKVTVLGYAGENYPENVLRELRELGINLEMLSLRGKPTIFELRYKEGKRKIRLISRSPKIELSHLNIEASGVLVNPVAGEVSLKDMTKVTERVHIIAIDVQGFVRSINERGEISYYWSRELMRSLSLVDILHADEEEIAPLGSTLEAIKKLAKRAKVVAITMGRLGSMIAFENTLYRVIPPYVYDGDETGAGDVYIAVLMVYISKGYNPLEAAKLATIAAGLKVKRSLATIRWYDRKEVEELAERVHVERMD